MNYTQKYIKYKSKYIQYKNQIGGFDISYVHGISPKVKDKLSFSFNNITEIVDYRIRFSIPCYITSFVIVLKNDERIKYTSNITIGEGGLGRVCLFTSDT